VNYGDSLVSSIAALSWQNQLFRKVCRDLKIDEGEETGILKSRAELVRGFRKKLVFDRFD
jgi:hypothetical protein